MSRTVTRVAPLPDPFALAIGDVYHSPLRGRLVFLALPDEPAARRLAAALTDGTRTRLVPWQVGLFESLLSRPWLAYQLDSDVGLAQLVGPGELLAALRALADGLYAPVAEGAELLVDYSPAHANAQSVAAIRAIYPDAVVVTTREVAAAAPEHVRVGLVLGTDPDAVTAALPGPTGSVVTATDVPVDPSLVGRLVVVVGCGRSGTTWLEELLMAHPDVGGAPRTESWLFQQLAPLWAAYDETALSTHVERERFLRVLRRFCDTVLAAARDRHRPGSRFVVEKTPMHSYQVPLINGIYPDAWIVHLVRDGRDVARSMSQVPFFQVPDPADAARLWHRVVTTVRRDATGLPRYRELRYEALHADPVAVMSDVFRWLGLGVAGPVVERVAAAAGERVSTHAGTAAEVGPGSWRTLPRADLARVYRAAGDLLVREGYVTRAEVVCGRIAPRPIRPRVVGLLQAGTPTGG